MKTFSGILWERICRREFPREERQEFESWREVYDRCLVARQEKLDFLTVKVQQSYKNVSHSDLPLFVQRLPISI